MNYLAHIHLAHVSNTSKLGNFLGDFVKGSDLSYLPTDLQEGITLHRKIDSFTDSHKHIRVLKQGMPKHLRRMSGVIFDVYFDHLLCHHWDDYTQAAQYDVLKAFYAELSHQNLALGPHFDRVKEGLVMHKWLSGYAKQKGYLNAFYSIETRLNNKIMFADKAFQFLQENQQMLRDIFLQFYPELIHYTLAQSSSN